MELIIYRYIWFRFCKKKSLTIYAEKSADYANFFHRKILMLGY